ncbi:hypothetical protein BAE44_0025524 [Dichanthelium oligosanthes]|uniref:BHLH domain-containing protein n=1 Tax=Dichanthelium oligosanthes TaxID=888268 RepID=A0A1E5UKP6_9POAL|nr:hypothetical protein BAE44_0025524 [Dichanthelium oligosanthes]
MVWKAAAQTRFRVFKHENGIAVRVIACFQPPQNCQVMRKQAKCRVLPPSPQARDVASLCSPFAAEETFCFSYLFLFAMGILMLNLFLVISGNFFGGGFFMGDKVNPWCQWPNPPWKFNTESSVGNLYPPDVGLVGTNSVALPTYLNTVAAPVQFFTASFTDRPLPMAPRFVTTLAPSLELSALYPSHKRSLVFYRENHTPIAAPLVSKWTLDPVPELQGSNETNITDVGAEETEGIHENTDEINALLDSDSDEGYEKVQELNIIRRPSPAENDTLSVESVASAGASAGSGRPAKKRRLNSGTDKSVVDTASSARLDHSIEQKLLVNDCDAQSCCIGEVESSHKFALGEGEAADGDNPDDQKRRRERIQETVAALRKIVPGGIAKDATAVLDEAICYLQYLKVKVKTLGAVSL